MKRILFLAVMILAGAAGAGVVRDTDLEPVADPSLDIASVETSRTPDGRMVFAVSTIAAADPAHVRVLLDVEPGRGESKTGADFMMEGGRFFAYPAGGRGWTWNEIEAPIAVSDGNRIFCVLPARADIVKGSWMAASTDERLQSVDIAPGNGWVEFTVADLPVWDPPMRVGSGDVGELIERQQYSLSVRFDTDVKSVRWKELPEHGQLVYLAAFGGTWPMRIALTDVVSGESVELKKYVAAGGEDQHALRLSGKDLGISWDIVVDGAGTSAQRVQGQFVADGERCIRVGVFIPVAPSEWVWHDDPRSARRMDSGPSSLANTIPSSFGLHRERSLYPFGVISGKGGLLAVETDPSEPRVFQIKADAEMGAFGVWYDLAITAGSSNFPRRATFACTFRSYAGESNAFARALAEFQACHPAYRTGRAKAAGLCLPLADPASIADAGDFGFTFHLSGGQDALVASCDRYGLLPLLWTEPLVHWLAMPAPVARDNGNAEILLRLGMLDAGRRGELCASSLLCGTRRPDGSLAMEFGDVPWNSGAKISACADPDVRTTPELPMSRAMSEWRLVRRFVDTPRRRGVYLDSMGAEAADYSPASIGVADMPCTYEADVLRPCLANAFPGLEYASLLRRAIEDRDAVVAGAEAGADLAFLAPLLDVVVKEVRWFDGGRFDPGERRRLLALRALSGGKPVVLLLNARFGDLRREDMKAYFDECLFWGFMPGVFSEDGVRGLYWENPEWIERDRPLFRTYVPVVRRIADAGWTPVAFAESGDARVQINCFRASPGGVGHLTLRNESDEPVETVLRLSPDLPPCVMLNPLNGQAVIARGTNNLSFLPGETRALTLVPREMLAAEAALLRSGQGASGEAADALARTLDSVRAELEAGFECMVDAPLSIMQGETNRILVEVRNTLDRAVQASGLRVIGEVYREAGGDVHQVPPGAIWSTAVRFAADDVPGNGWIEVQWTLVDGESERVCTRWLKPRVTRRPALPDF